MGLDAVEGHLRTLAASGGLAAGVAAVAFAVGT